MIMIKVMNVKLRKILNSVGSFAYEAEVTLEGEYSGIASSPSAIVPGIREKRISQSNSTVLEIGEINGNYFDQSSLDKLLENKIESLGTDITLSISMAFARAMCKAQGISLVEYITSLISLPQHLTQITPLVPIFSAGVHAPWLHGSLQQIMLKVSDKEFTSTVKIIQNIYDSIEQFLISSNKYIGLAASSGFLTKDLTPDDEFCILTNFIDKSPYKDNLSIAIDVAAEHLKQDDEYIYFNTKYTASDFEHLLIKYVNAYPITYVEDPFDSRNKSNWTSLRHCISGKAEIFTDDYSATQSKYLDSRVSDGAIIKMKQVGTLSSTLLMINKARKMGLKTCVSHRSCETEDTFICDLAVATCSDYIKIGGLRRGDRVEKYNRLLRIYGLSL